MNTGDYAGSVVFKIDADVKNFDKKYESVKKELADLENKAHLAYKIGETEVYDGSWNLSKEETQRYNELRSILADLEQKRYDMKINEEIMMEELSGQTEKLQQQATITQEVATHEETQAEKVARMSTELEEMVQNWKSMQNSDIVSSQDIADAEQLKNDIIETTQELEKMTGQSYNIKGITDIKPKLQEVHSETKKIHVSADGVLKKFRNWGLAIFGVRSMYSLITRAINVVSNGNEKLGNQMMGIKNSFFMAFEPLVERLVNLLRKLMAYINYISEQLFGYTVFTSKGADNLNKSLASGAKSAKEIKNQLTSFDEANVLTKNDTSSSGLGGGNNKQYDLKFAEIKIPQWLKDVTSWIKKNPKWAKILAGLTAFTVLGGWQKAAGLTSFISSLIGKKKGDAGTGLLGLKNILTLTAIAWTIKLTWEGFDLFGYHIAGVKEFITTLKDTMSAQKSRNETIDASLKKDKELVEQSKKVLSSDKSTNEERKTSIKLLDVITQSQDQFARTTSMGLPNQMKNAAALFENAKEMDNLYRKGKLTDEEQYAYYKMLQNQLNPTMEKTTGWIMGQTNESKKLKDSFNQLDKKYKTQYEIEMKQTGSSAVETAITKIQTALSNLFGNKKTLSVSVIIDNMRNAVANIFKHADGGIINYPGRGVPLHIGGEAGREGIVPMDNEQQMQLLGQSIAKYVRIDNYISNYMDARQINTLLKQSENRAKLASNK